MAPPMAMAAPGTVSGRLTGAPIPKPASGAADVQAIRIDTGVITGALRVGALGSYSLKLEPGPYVLIGTLINSDGAALLSGTGAPLTLRSGERRTVDVAVNARLRPLAPKSADAALGRFSQTTSGPAHAIEIDGFAGASGNLAPLNTGLAAMLQTNMATSGGSCPTLLIANARQRADVDARLARRNDRTPAQSARTQRYRVASDIRIRGRLSGSRSTLTYRITISDSQTGRALSVKRGRLKIDAKFFSKVSAIGTNLTARVCKAAAPSQLAPALPAPALPRPPTPPPPPVDNVAPQITLTQPASGSSTNAQLPAFTGFAGTATGDSTSVTVRLYAGASPSGLPRQTLTTLRGAGGSFVAGASDPLAPGIYTARVEQADAAGNTGFSTSNTFTVGAPTADPTLIGAGDIAGCGQTVGTGATAALLAQHPDALVFTLGDNAYPSGQPSDFANCYDPTWGLHKARTRPITGGHDSEDLPGGAPPNQGFSDYFSAQLAPFGATATNRLKTYYSYDIGTWHVIALNTACYRDFPECNTQQQERWFENDLDAHQNACTAVMWHDARWSSGNVHGGERFTQPLWDLAYNKGADIVLSGNEHTYERFAPQDKLGVRDDAFGVRQFVVGTGGYYLYGLGTTAANSQAFGTTYGVLKLTLHPASYDWQFIPVAGQTYTDSGSGSCHAAP